MKNTNKILKTIVFSLGLAVMTLTATNLNAQDRGLFGLGKASNDAEFGGSRGAMNIEGNTAEGISNYGIGETVPLGSGLVILLGAGLGYVALKKKED